MLEMALTFTATAIMFVSAVIAWGLEYRWQTHPRRTQQRWAHALMLLLVAGSALDCAVTVHAHGQEWEEQERSARIEEGVQELVKLARERDPNLTEQEALREIIGEIQALRERTTELEHDLEARKNYSKVAELDACGILRVEKLGLTRTTAISRIVTSTHTCKKVGGEVVVRINCDEQGMAAFQKAAEIEPDFPFSYWAQAVCGEQAGDKEWPTHAEGAVTILEHTTDIPGHHEHHDKALEQLRQLLATQESSE